MVRKVWRSEKGSYTVDDWAEDAGEAAEEVPRMGAAAEVEAMAKVRWMRENFILVMDVKAWLVDVCDGLML